MKAQASIARLAVATCLIIAAGCGKEELVVPSGSDPVLRNASTSADAIATGENAVAKDPSSVFDPMTLRDGGDGLDGGGSGGGISDDGDDEADGERTKK
jgi:hypothetical protein